MMQPVSSPQAPTHIPPGHSGRLRYATPQELPSYPSIGLRQDSAAASAAATLGWANQKTIEPWKPASLSSSASAAALLANDYKMPPVREPERSSAPYQAAILAVGSAQKSPRQEPVSPQSTWGNSAANMAFKAANASTLQSPKTEQARSPSRQQSLRGAHGAVAGSRPRSMSTPQKQTYPDQANAAANALNAATVAHRPSAKPRFDEAGAVPYTNMSREMFTSRPPVKPEVDEKQHADSLHASAVAMAKRMYTQQQKMIDNTKRNEAGTTAARSSSFSRHGRVASDTRATEPASGFPNLQEAAYRLAQERLAKLQEEHQKNREFQESQDWYGSLDAQQNSSRLGSIRGKLTRRRSSSDGDLVEDRKRSQQIRQQMSAFNTKLSKVDEEKRARDRQALLAAAQRNVKAQLEGMDRKLYEDTGRVPPSRLNDWEVKAHSSALLRVESSKNENAGKVDLGAGKFMDQDEVNAIAAKRVQPVIDDINRKAEIERERQMAARLEEERRKEELERDKQREKEVQDVHKKLKDQQKEEEKHRKMEAKEAERARKEQEKAAKAEEKRVAKEEKQRHKEEVSKPVALDLKERSAEDDGLEQAEPETAALIAPIPPVAILPVEAPKLTVPDENTNAALSQAGNIKEEGKEKREEEKLNKAEQKRLAKEEKRKSKSLKKPLALDLRKRVAREDKQPASAPLDQEPVAEMSKSPSDLVRERTQSFSGRRASSPPLDDEPRSPTHRIRNWFSTHFSRPRTQSSSSAAAATEEKGTSSGINSGGAAVERESGKGFIGGAALRRREGSNSDSDDSSLRDVAFASVSRDTNRPQFELLPTVAATPSAREPSPSRSVSSVSSLNGEEAAGGRSVEASNAGARPLTPPPARKDLAVVGRLSVSPGRGSRFSEIID